MEKQLFEFNHTNILLENENQRQISYVTSMDWIYATTKNKIMKTAVKCFFFNSRKYLYSSIYPETSITLVAQW